MTAQGNIVKVRFAPSPTGTPHIGGLRTALYNYLIAKNNRGKFFLRIEDTDRKRFIKDAEEAIINSLKWLGLEWDDEIIYQSKRLDIYKKHSDLLLSKEIAYEKDGAVWIKMPDKNFTWTDLVGNKKISFNGNDQEDFVILKSDGFPTYHLANVIDDHLMEITHVIRGEEWISSVPKHLFLYESFGWTPPLFAHLPVILGSDKGKLSKRHGAKSALDYKEEGFLKETILNFIALLGWNPGENKEVMTIDEMVSFFRIQDINTSNPKFDSQKLEWMNGVWIRSLSTEDLEKRLLEFYSDNKEIQSIFQNNQKTINKILELAQTRLKTLAEFNEMVIEPIYQKNNQVSNGEEKFKQEIKKKLEKISEDNWNQDTIFASFKEVMNEHNLKMSVFYKIFTGKERGLPLPQVLEILGKEKTLEKLA